MSAESSNLFKVFRVLWFPVSVNAVLLGAGGTLLFWLVTSLASWGIGGDLDYADTAARAFPRAAFTLVTDFDWPGYATAEVDGNPVHVLRAEDATSASERATVVREEAWLREVFRGWVAGREAELRTEEDLSAEELQSRRRALALVPPRYRVVFGFQLVAFFILLATVGVAICRALAVRVARDEYCTLSEAWGYAWKTKVTGLLFPPAVLLPLLFLVVMNFLAGAVVGLPVVGGLFGLVLVPLAYVASALIFLIGLAAVLALGLVPSAIAVERKGTYDCLGKAFNYIFARPLPLLLYLALTALFLGFLHEVLVEGHLLERLLLGTTNNPWWGGEDYEAMLLGNQEGTEGFFATIWTFLHGILHTVYRLLLWGVLISFALGSQLAVFLILRKEIDGLDHADLAADPVEEPRPAAAAPAEAPRAD